MKKVIRKIVKNSIPINLNLKMRFTTLLLFVSTFLFSCSSMESDAQKACGFMTETVELMPEMMKLSMKANFGEKTEVEGEAKDWFDAQSRQRG